MKSSIKFREEKSPLLRGKLPFNLGPIPFSSGIAVGHKQDLSVHLGVGFSAFPIIKLALKPHDPNPLSLVLKAGLGLWGSPNDAPLALTAEICLTPSGSDRLLSLRIKPKIGDFSIRKDVRNVSFSPPQQKEVTTTSVRLQLHENGEQNYVTTHHKSENGSLLSSFSNGDALAAPKHMNGNCLDKEQLCGLSVDSSTAAIVSNVSMKIEGVEKGCNDFKPIPEEQHVEADMSANGNAMIVHVPYPLLHERRKADSRQSSASFSFAGVQDALRGCNVSIHSSLPFGNQARLNVRWGVKSAPEFLHGWDGSLPSLSFSKLPSLLLDKVSFEQVASRIEKPLTKAPGPLGAGSFEQGLLPASFVDENRELAQVASMCYTMKRQLHLMHAENQVLRRAMEEMKSHVESKGSWIPSGIADGALMNGQSIPRPSHKSTLLDVPLPRQQRRDRDVQVQKGQKVMPRKDDDVFSSPGNNVDVSKELEKAILNAQIGSSAGK